MEKYTEEEYREALEIWLNKNPGKTVNDISRKERIIISSGKEINLGMRISNMREALKGKGTSKMTDSLKEYWVGKYNLSIGNQKRKQRNNLELKYREAFEIWLSKNSGKTINDVPLDEKIIISSGEEINLGMRIVTMMTTLKKNNQRLTEEYQSQYWVDKYGLSSNRIEKIRDDQELKYRKAFEIWLSKNPGKTINDIPNNEKVIINSGEEINLGMRIVTMMTTLKKNNQRLTEEYQSQYWVDKYGLSSNRIDKIRDDQELKYREALEIWLSKNPGKTINDIPKNEKVIISSGEKINLGQRISSIKLVLGNKRNGFVTKSQRKYWIDKHGLSVDNKKENQRNELEIKYREALEIWLSKNPGKTINDIPRNEVLNIKSGETIKLGVRISNIRKICNGTKNGKLTEEQKLYWLEQCGLNIENQKERKNFENELKYREALEIWLSKNPGKTINDVPYNEIIKISNYEDIPLGTRITSFRTILKYEQQIQKTIQKPHGTISESQRKYWIDEHGLKVSNLQIEDNILESCNGNLEKATKRSLALKSLREKRKLLKKEEYDLNNVLKEFDVDLQTLNQYLSRVRNIEENTRDKALMKDDETLRSYCIKNNYNYDLIAKAIRLHKMCPNESLEELINRVISEKATKLQKEPSIWIYQKYGNLVKHELLYLGLDSASILKNMTDYVITLEEAIRHDVFRLNVTKKENKWLEELYNYVIEEIDSNKDRQSTETDLAEMFYILVDEYELSHDEFSILWNVFEKYINTMKQYQKLEVGLETDEAKRLEKIKEYNFDEYDIEESFFIPLEFDNKVLIGRKSELYKRRQLIRQFIIDWNDYSEIEKCKIISENNFNDSELQLINKTRNKINKTIDAINKK